MINIKMNAYEKNDLIHFLRYSKEKNKEDFKAGKVTQKMLEMNLDKIKTLEKRLNGIIEVDYMKQKSTGGFV